MKEKELSDRSKNAISVFAILLFALVLFFYLFFSTNLFSQNVGDVAQIKKIEKKIAEINIPNLPEMELDVEHEGYEEGLEVPSIPAGIDFDFIADHRDYGLFSEAYFTRDNGVLSISDSLIYNTGHYSLNGGGWVDFTLSGTQYENYPFLLDNGQIDLPNALDSQGTHFIIIFSCSLINNNQAWDCHGGDLPGKWQLEVIQNSGNENAGPSCYNGVQDGDETGIDCGGNCVSCNPNSNTGNLDVNHLHLMWENSEQTDTSMDVIWEDSSGSSSARVYYDTISRNCNLGQYNYDIVASGSSFSQANTRIKHAALRNLQPNTNYFFCIESGGDYYQEHYFRTAPSSGTDFTFIMGGDTQGRGESRDFHDLTREAMEEEPLFILHSGDGSQNAKVDDWNMWMDAVEDFKTSSGRIIPIIPSVGGHDIYQGGEIFWHAYYTLPGDELHFYHDIGDLRVITLYLPDSEKSSLNIPAQLPLLTSALQGARSEGKWTLVQYHDPMYPSQKPVTNDARRMREYWEPVFDEYEVPLVLEGANHVYKRTHPLYNGQITDIFTGTVHIGDGGWPASRSGIEDENEWAIVEHAFGPQVAIVEMSSSSYNQNNQNTWMNIRVITPSGEEIDQVNIPK